MGEIKFIREYLLIIFVKNRVLDKTKTLKLKV
jgi:hypothetical protein